MKKLTSRKFWIALCGFVTAICVAFGADELTVSQICAVLGALGTLCAYILAEGYADGKNAKSDTSADSNGESDTEDYDDIFSEKWQ